MDFNRMLVSIDNELSQEDLDSLKFLCSDLLPPKKLLSIKSSLELFTELQKISLLEEDKYDLLAELLYIIGQHSLLKVLATTKWRVQEALREKRTVSLYRQMLFQLYENITSDDLRTILFLLGIPKKYEEGKKFLEVLSYLEKNDQLSENKLDVLENAVGYVSPDLHKKINEYKKTIEIQKPTAQSFEDENDKTQFSIQDQDQVEGSYIETIQEPIQHISETVSEKDLMAENTGTLAELSLNEDPKLEIYSMNRKHRGYCLIINNEQFMKSEPRTGTEKDAEFLHSVFTWLGLHVEIRTNLLAKEIRNCLTEFKEKDHSERDCFVSCILTHGKSKAIYGTDDIDIPISEITSYFSTTNCSTLAGKPKLFFIQACQGNSSQGAHAIEPDAVSDAEKKRPKITIPNDADILVGMSTVDGYYAYRHNRTGTWYIQSLCENLTKLVPKGEDILSILTKVNKDVSEKEYSNLKQMPQPAYTLLRKLVFPIPPAPFKPASKETNF
ncbi:caspase-8-like [Anomaloglossus baeobatrachus]|uniref:caspase-8-like n=1 Tax=Anomaloglossus baeobatrachus TaxID=238106 RepID=UPI003F4FEAF8